MYQLTCPSCQQLLQCDDSLMGQTIACPKCGQLLALSAPETRAPAPSYSPPAPPAPPMVEHGSGETFEFGFQPAATDSPQPMVRKKARMSQSQMIALVASGMGVLIVLLLVAIVMMNPKVMGLNSVKGSIERLKSSDPDARREAAASIVRGGTDEVHAALEAITDIPDEKRAGVIEGAARELAAAGPSLTPALVAALKSDSKRARLGAAAVLLEMGRDGKGAVRALRDGLMDERNLFFRRTATEALGKMGTAAAPAADAMAAMLTHPDMKLRLLAAKSLSNVGPAANAAGMALHITTQLERDPQIRKAAQAALEKVDPEKVTIERVKATNLVVRDLVRHLGDGDDETRASAAKDLGDQGPQAVAAVIALYKALRDDRIPAVRTAAAEALGRLGEHATYTIPALEARLNDADASVQAAAKQAIKELRAAMKAPSAGAKKSEEDPEEAPSEK
jgi:hypothetical protein